MSGHDACPDRAGKSGVGMQNCAILNIGASPDRDALGVATEHGVEPDARFGREDHVADELSAVSNVGSSVNLGIAGFRGSEQAFINLHFSV